MMLLRLDDKSDGEARRIQRFITSKLPDDSMSNLAL